MKLPGGSDYHLLVKYNTPESSLSAFAEKINLQAGGWPSTLCGETRAVVTAYDYNSNIIGASNATVVSGNFETDMPSGVYQLGCGQGKSETFNLRYTIKINGGPEREIRPYSGTNVRVYNGFEALPPIAIELKNDNIIVPGQFKTLLAGVCPNPALDAGFTYEWFAVNEGNGPGYGYFDQNGVPFNMTRFSASCPGDYNIAYRASYNGETSTSGYLSIKVGPEIFIDNPLENNQKYCFNQNGELIILAEGHTNPEENGEDLVWDISPVDGTNLTTDPSDRQGTLVEFDLNGLPPSNDAFGDNNGKNWIKAMLQLENCLVEAKKPFTLFYLKDKKDHGGGVPTDINWYHYWKQGAAPALIGTTYKGYSPRCSFGEYIWENDEIAIYVLAADCMESHDLGVGVIFPRKEGVDIAQDVAIHEAFHKEIYHNWSQYYNGIWYQQYGAEHPVIMGFTDPVLRKWPGVDSDGDMLPDEYERNMTNFNGFPITLNPDTGDTHNLYVRADYPVLSYSYALIGDQEVLARLAAIFEMGINDLDWSRGKYSKNWSEYVNKSKCTSNVYFEYLRSEYWTYSYSSIFLYNSRFIT